MSRRDLKAEELPPATINPRLFDSGSDSGHSSDDSQTRGTDEPQPDSEQHDSTTLTHDTESPSLSKRHAPAVPSLRLNTFRRSASSASGFVGSNRDQSLTSRLTGRANNASSRPGSRHSGGGGGKGSSMQPSLSALGSTSALGFFSPRQAQEFVEDFGKEDLATVLQRKIHAQDPYNFARRPSFKFPNLLWSLTIVIPTASWMFMLICYGIDAATSVFSGYVNNVYDLVFSSLNPDIDQARGMTSTVLQTMSVVFGLLITIIGIILQMAARRFTSHVTSLFFRDAYIVSSLGYIVICNAFVFFVKMAVGPGYVPRAAVVLSMFLVTSHLTLLLPFLAYMFWFLDPEKVVTKIMMIGLKAASDSIYDTTEEDLSRHQVQVTLSIEHLMDVANSGLERRDKNITAEIVDTMCSFIMLYGEHKDKMPPQFFEVPNWIRQSVDFLTLSDEAIGQLTMNKSWVEWKIMRQYQVLFTESLKYMKDLCYHISLNTRLMGEAAGKRGDLAVLDLSMKFFNTYLRFSLNMPEIRTVYNVLFQYRQLAEWIVEFGQLEREEKLGMLSETARAERLPETEVERRAVRIAKYIRFYASVAQEKNIAFLVETMAQDLRILTETSFFASSPMHAELLDIFLMTSDGSDVGKVNEGVRRAQIILATTYLCTGSTPLAQRIFEDLKNEDHKMLWGLMQELLSGSNKFFWEVNERGTNFNFLTPEQKAKLPTFFQWFPNFLDNPTLAADVKLQRLNAQKAALHNFN